MKRSTDRILTSHVGSLVRPPKIRDVMDAKETGAGYDDGKFQGVLRDEVKDVVRRQTGAGTNVISDGEFGKAGCKTMVWVAPARSAIKARWISARILQISAMRCRRCKWPKPFFPWPPR